MILGVGIDLVVTPQTDGTGLGDVASLVTEHETKPGKDGRDTIRLRISKLDQARSTKLREFLERCL